MIGKTISFIIFSLVCFLLTIIQTVFLPFFNIWGVAPNLLFILFFFVIFFSNKKDFTATFFMILMIGFFSDIISQSHFGIFIGTYVILYFLHLFINNFLQDRQGKNVVVYFIGEFCVLFLLCHFTLNPSVLVHLLYSLLFALTAFYVCQTFIFTNHDNNQLKLL